MNEKTKTLAEKVVCELTDAGRDDILWMSILLYSFNRRQRGLSTLIDDLLAIQHIKEKTPD